ncbi:MAG: acyl-CoA N-acyltransferase [Benjaminiella poitrasii]|nr:MAG: acyl-CoA N-acyltransferase [Benjaminiella poitrasii]
MTVQDLSQIEVRLVKDKRLTPVACQVINAAFRSDESWTNDKAVVGKDRVKEYQLNEFLDQPDSYFLYAFDKEEVVGVIWIHPSLDAYMLSMLSVRPSHQSRGLGALLVNESIHFIQHELPKTRTTIAVYVFQYRIELLAWYRRMGFVDDKVIPFPDKSVLTVDEAPLVIMKYSLV